MHVVFTTCIVVNLLHWCKCCFRKCDQRMTSQYVTSEQEILECGKFRNILRGKHLKKKKIFKYKRIDLTKLYFVRRKRLTPGHFVVTQHASE